MIIMDSRKTKTATRSTQFSRTWRPQIPTQKRPKPTLIFVSSMSRVWSDRIGPKCDAYVQFFCLACALAKASSVCFSFFSRRSASFSIADRIASVKKPSPFDPEAPILAGESRKGGHALPPEGSFAGVWGREEGA